MNANERAQFGALVYAVDSAFTYFEAKDRMDAAGRGSPVEYGPITKRLALALDGIDLAGEGKSDGLKAVLAQTAE